MTESKTCPITGKECFPWKCMWGSRYSGGNSYTCGLLIAIANEQKRATLFFRKKDDE